MVRRRKRKTEAQRVKKKEKQHYGKKLKHAVHNLGINAHKYESSKRQILQIKDK